MDVPCLDLKLEYITPCDAIDYLAANYSGNRNIRVSAKDRYAETMRKKQWRDFTSMIVFDSEGNLIDGQHRLSAQIEAEATVGYVVLRGLETSSYSVINSGVKRGLADRSSMTTLESTIASAMAKYNAGLPVKNCLTSITSGGQVAVTEADVIKYAEDNSDEITRVNKMYNRVRGCVRRLSTAAFATSYMISKERHGADVFLSFERELSKWDTECKQATAAQKSLTLSNGGRRTPVEQMAIIVRACDQYADGVIPKMPTKALVNEAVLKSWQKEVI